jgi:hypothetical protein
MSSVSRANSLFFACVVKFKELTNLLQEEAPDCTRGHALENYQPLCLMLCIYQFMFAIRQTDLRNESFRA